MHIDIKSLNRVHIGIDKYDAVISCLSKDEEDRIIDYSSLPFWRRISIWDTEQTPILLTPGENYTPSEEIIKKVFAIFNEIKNKENILFHCYMGASRSVSIAILFLEYIGYTSVEAEDIIRKKVVCFSPNKLILSLGRNFLKGKENDKC